MISPPSSVHLSKRELFAFLSSGLCPSWSSFPNSFPSLCVNRTSFTSSFANFKKQLSIITQPHPCNVSSENNSRSNKRNNHRKPLQMSTQQQEIKDWIESNLDMGSVTKFDGRMLGNGWSSTCTVHLDSGNKLFVKTSRQTDLTMFRGEADGLNAMNDTKTLLIPKVHYYGNFQGDDGQNAGSWILMDYLEMGGGARLSQEQLGSLLAKMHKAQPLHKEARKGSFGFPVDNTIGGTPQINTWNSDWVDFFSKHRIMYQVNITSDSALIKLGQAVCEKMPMWFQDIHVQPCILHGDLWSGNIGAAIDHETGESVPTIFDPACYYGHNEAEFGMSWCAGFSNAFYDAYHREFPRQEKHFGARKKLYLAYHYLNHYNLFGGGYYNSAYSLLSELAGFSPEASRSKSKFYEY